MTEFPARDGMSDVEFGRWLIEHVGVAIVPASSFYRAGDPEARKMVRFCYPKRDETLLEAGRRLAKLHQR
jgi:methionine aminotransferase